MTAEGDEATFDARLDAGAEAAAFVAAYCARQGVDAHDALHVLLVVEELFLNIVSHGYGDATGGTIHLALAQDEQGVLIAFEDHAQEYDPRVAFERVPDDLDAPVEERSVGGLGLWLVGRVVEVVRYERSDDANRLSLRVLRTRPRGP
jgi:anti-sigma regulatory factor (Ser/Thr protein kinase)